MNIAVSKKDFVRFAGVVKELHHARQKHPKFCIALLSDDVSLDELKRLENEARECCEAYPVAWNIIAEEEIEAFVKAREGDFAGAWCEFAQVAAVAMRCMEECDKRSKVHRRDVFGTAKENGK